MTQEELEKLALENMRNFGVPECYYCGDCGQKYKSREELIGHVEEGCEG